MRRSTATYLACAAALAWSAAGAEAQSIGFKIGAAFSTLSASGEAEGFETKTGLAGGGFIRFGLGRLGIQPEILTVAKGAAIDGGETGEDAELEIEYLEVPVLLHLPLTSGASFAPYVYAGPVISFDMGCEFSSPGREEDVDCEDAGVLGESAFVRKSTDFGVTAGGGLAFALGPGALLLEGRYTWGLTNINDNAGPDQSEVKNRSALLLAGYTIHLR